MVFLSSRKLEKLSNLKRDILVEHLNGKCFKIVKNFEKAYYIDNTVLQVEVHRGGNQKLCVVYFDQSLGAVHPKCWSKYAFVMFLTAKS